MRIQRTKVLKMIGKSVDIRRMILNDEEIWDHYASQKILTRLIPKSRLSIGLAFTPRLLNWDNLEKTLDKNIKELNESNSEERKTILYGSNRVLSLELTSSDLEDRQKTLSEEKATFFELTNYKPHIVLDYNLSENVENWSSLKPYTGKIRLGRERLTEADLSFRTKIRYKPL